MLMRLLGDKALRSKELETITEFNEDLTKLVNDMINAMYQYNGRGLSANQIGVLKRVFVMDSKYKINEKGEKINQTPQVMINPVLKDIELEDVIDFDEACLSIPGVHGVTKRSIQLTLSFQDLNGVEQTVIATGLEAVIIQHEMDHLHGQLFIDRLSSLRREMVVKKYNKGFKKYARSIAAQSRKS